jgi:hypothetical protein
MVTRRDQRSNEGVLEDLALCVASPNSDNLPAAYDAPEMPGRLIGLALG